jgi:hypothetical protein
MKKISNRRPAARMKATGPTAERLGRPLCGMMKGQWFCRVGIFFPDQLFATQSAAVPWWVTERGEALKAKFSR